RRDAPRPPEERRPVGPGEGVRRVLSARTLDRDRRGPERRHRADAAERGDATAGVDDRHGLRGRDADRIHHVVHDAPAGRRAVDGNPRGCGEADRGRSGGGRGGGRRHVGEPGGGMSEPVSASGSGVRCRFAPAPSGSIHVGNARSALFSWLFARHEEGGFVLRVEDTDASRVSEEAFRGVVESLRWFGLDWDEGPDVGGPRGPYRQSQRADVYREHVDRLLQQGDAYRCFCTAEELEERRRAALTAGLPPGYDGRCRRLTDAERRGFEAEGRPSAVRFAMPERDMTIVDLVKGEVQFPARSLSDFVIVRSDGSPVFLLAVAVDDMLMGITHVVRGDDLLASAPRNAAVIEALGGVPPRYAHLPQVLGPDGKPLSKR